MLGNPKAGDESVNPFATYHPAVAFSFLAAAVVFAMAALHPVYVALSAAGSFACLAAVRGMRHAVRQLAWAAPMCVLVALANVVFVASGSTELFRIGSRAFYAESLFYGLCSGGVLAAVLMWFSSYAACMTSDNAMDLTGGVFPTVTLMVSQVMRLVPQFLARGRTIMAVQDAASAARPISKRDRALSRLRVASVLMGWGMEDGIDRSDAMRARGYACGIARTRYRRRRFRASDARAVVAVALLAAANVPLVLTACAQFQFYPVASVLVLWWGYVPYAVLMATPVFLRLKEWWQWRS